MLAAGKRKKMTHVAEQVYKQLYKYLNDLLSLKQIEQWIYEQDDLLYEISPDLHDDLITFNFTQKNAAQKLNRLVYHITQVQTYEQWKKQKAGIELKIILEGIIDKTPVWEQLLRNCYWDLWDDSSKLKFLDVLADMCFFKSLFDHFRPRTTNRIIPGKNFRNNYLSAGQAGSGVTIALAGYKSHPGCQ